MTKKKFRPKDGLHFVFKNTHDMSLIYDQSLGEKYRSIIFLLMKLIHIWFLRTYWIKFLVGEDTNTIEPPKFYSGNFMEDMKRALFEVGILTYKNEEKSRMKTDGDVPVSKFLNRLLGLQIGTQQALFQYFR